jgi:hypothetical protein
VDRKNEEIFGLQNDVLALREMAKEHALLVPQNAELQAQNQQLLARAADAEHELEACRQRIAAEVRTALRASAIKSGACQGRNFARARDEV